MKAKVWFKPIKHGDSGESLGRKVVGLADSAGLADMVCKNALVGILQHVGEGRGTGYVKPPVTRALAARIRKLGGKPFLTGSSTLYRGNRSNACDHIMQAYEHGFTFSGINCPIVMCDGLRGTDKIDVKLPGGGVAHIGSAVAQMQALLVVTHPTGHPSCGFGSAMKNVAMGLASRGGKLSMHHGRHPLFLEKRCTGCGKCAQWCPADAVEVEKKARLIKAKCIGCGQCLAVCRFDAIDFSWKISGTSLQEKLVDYCAVVESLLNRNIVYVNVIQHFQKGCDCYSVRHPALCPDAGIAASRDLVAVDAATADLLARAAGKDVVRETAGMEYREMFAYAEKIGLGRQKYELVES